MGVSGFLAAGCMPAQHFSPSDADVILLSDKSTASVVGHFERKESRTIWLWQWPQRELQAPDVIAGPSMKGPEERQ